MTVMVDGVVVLLYGNEKSLKHPLKKPTRTGRVYEVVLTISHAYSVQGDNKYYLVSQRRIQDIVTRQHPERAREFMVRKGSPIFQEFKENILSDLLRYPDKIRRCLIRYAVVDGMRIITHCSS